MADFQSVPLTGHKIKSKRSCEVSPAYFLLAAALGKDQPVWAVEFLMCLCSLEREWGWGSVPGGAPQLHQGRNKGRGLGLRAVSGHSGLPQIQGANCNKFIRSACETVQRLPEQRILWNSENLVVTLSLAANISLHNLFQGAVYFSTSFWATLSVVSFRVTSVRALVFIRKKDVFFCVVVILVCSAGGQKKRCSLPQLPSVQQCLWLDSQPAYLSKTKVWLFCMKVILCASWHCKSTFPWQSSNYAERWSSACSPPTSAFSSCPQLFQLKVPACLCLHVSPSTGFPLLASSVPLASECSWSLRAVNCWQHFCVHIPHGPKAGSPASRFCEICQTPTP